MCMPWDLKRFLHGRCSAIGGNNLSFSSDYQNSQINPHRVSRNSCCNLGLQAERPFSTQIVQLASTAGQEIRGCGAGPAAENSRKF